MMKELDQAIVKGERGEYVTMLAPSREMARNYAQTIRQEWMARPEALDCEITVQPELYRIEVGGWTDKTTEEKCVEWRIYLVWPRN